MPADNQLGGHGDMWSHCFPEGFVNAASPNHLWFQCLGHDADLQINSNGSKLIQNWNCPICLQVMFFSIFITIENMNRKGIMWVKASEGTAMPCGFTRHPNTAWAKSPSKCYNIVIVTVPLLKLIKFVKHHLTPLCNICVHLRCYHLQCWKRCL